jgi:lysosomal Pro-X carboxypeptidase
MWENAAEFGAMLIFAEHRFYGESKPFPEGTDKCLDWLTTEQAMADFAQLIDHFRTTDDRFTKSAVVGFGGSYGGMIGAWFRVKYPNAADGVIAASAPIWSFTGLDPPYNYQAFSEGVTHDLSAGAGAGASDNCKKNLHAAYPLMQSTGRTKEGRAMLSSAFKTCYAIETEEEVAALISWAQGPFANMAMGNYPYPSTYLMHGDSFLPAWPMRKACEALDADGLTGKPEELFEAVREALAVQLNNTGTTTCFYNGDEREMRATLKDGETMADVYGERVRMAGKKMTDAHRMVRRWERREGRKRGLRGERQMAADGSCAGDWDMQWCTEMSQPFSYGCPDPDPIFPEDGAPADFHWPCEPFNKTVRTESCLENWGFQPRYDWARFGLGGKRISGASNIVFSNGLYDPWHGGGILKNLSDTLIAVVLPHGAHHLDLMFSNPADPPDAVDARKTEVQEMKRWVKDANQRNGNTLYQIAL